MPAHKAGLSFQSSGPRLGLDGERWSVRDRSAFTSKDSTVKGKEDNTLQRSGRSLLVRSARTPGETGYQNLLEALSGGKRAPVPTVQWR